MAREAIQPETTKHLRWNPAVHERFQQALVFYLLKVRVFKKTRLIESLRGLVDKENIGAFRIYEVYGAYDLVIRIWIPKGDEGKFGNALEALDNVIAVRPFTVWRWLDHWVWTDQPINTRALDKLTPETVRLIQEECVRTEPFAKGMVLLGNAERDGLVRLIEPGHVHVDGPLIKFFVFVTRSDAMDRSVDKNLLEKLASRLNEFKQNGRLQRTSIYAGWGPYWLMIKGETRDFYRIGDFVVAINEDLALYGGITSTHVVAEKDSIMEDLITERDFDRVRARDLAVAAIVPELYTTDAVSLDQLRAPIEVWVRNNVLVNEIDDEQVEVIRGCLLGVINQEEETFAARMLSEFRRAEKYLRANQGQFITRVLGPEAYHRVVQEAIGVRREAATSTQKIDAKMLALGDRLEVYAHVIREGNLTPGDDRLLNWGEIPRLRNIVVHSAEDLLPNWNQHLTTFLTFLTTFASLQKLVNDRINQKS